MGHISTQHLHVIQQALYCESTPREFFFTLIYDSQYFRSYINFIQFSHSCHIRGETRSARTSFYHVSFIEFLSDHGRSKEYWIGNQCHYTAMATALRLCKDLRRISYDVTFLAVGTKMREFRDYARYFLCSWIRNSLLVNV